MKGASRGLEGGLKPSALKGASRGLEGGLKRASRGLEGGFTFGRLQGGLKGASRKLQRGLKPSTLKGASSGLLRYYFTHVQTCNVTRVQSATEWTASVHTLHMSKPVM